MRDTAGTTRIEVTIDRGTHDSSDRGGGHAPVVTVRNDGRGVPVQMHKEYDVHVPELVFGQLMTGSNFSDTDGATTGGRHGYGAKLTNIFSHSFEVRGFVAAHHHSGITGTSQQHHSGIAVMSQLSGQALAASWLPGAMLVPRFS